MVVIKNRFRKEYESMNRNFKTKVGLLALTGTMFLSPAVSVLAAPTDIIDPGAKGSVSIHKYDSTAMMEDGVDFSQGVFQNNGKTDAKAEQTLEDYVIKGVEFSYLKVGDIHTDSQGGSIQVLYDIPTELEKLLELNNQRKNHQYTSDELNEALKAKLMKTDDKGQNELEKYFASNPNAHAMPLTDENGFTSMSNLDLGLYLIVETKVPANVENSCDPFFLSLPMTDVEGDNWFYDVNIYPKNQTDIPDLDKRVKQHDDDGKLPYKDIATVSEGDKVDYIFISRLPKINSSATYLTKYDFIDKMVKGLDYNKDEVIYFYNTLDDAQANNTDAAIATFEKGKDFTVTYDTADANYNSMTVRPTQKGLDKMNPELQTTYMVVSYSATVHSDNIPVLGDTGNPNDVRLEWKRTNMQEQDELEDRSKVYTFGLNIQKNFAGDDGVATEVEFVLQNKSDGHYIKAKQAEPGKYWVTDGSKGQTEAEGTVFSPNADGKLVIDGLEADTYILTEISTSDGYNLLKEPMTIDIKSTVDNLIPSRTTLYDIKDVEANKNKTLIETPGERASATVDTSATNMSTSTTITGAKSEHSRVDMAILNSKGFKLPQTGGVGTVLFTMAGCGAALIGTVVAANHFRKKKEDEK